MITSLYCHYTYLSIIITRSYQCLFTIKYCNKVIATQSSVTFTHSLVFRQAVKKDSVAINDGHCTTPAIVQCHVCDYAIELSSGCVKPLFIKVHKSNIDQLLKMCRLIRINDSKIQPILTDYLIITSLLLFFDQIFFFAGLITMDKIFCSCCYGTITEHVRPIARLHFANLQNKNMIKNSIVITLTLHCVLKNFSCV